MKNSLKATYGRYWTDLVVTNWITWLWLTGSQQFCQLLPWFNLKLIRHSTSQWTSILTIKILENNLLNFRLNQNNWLSGYDPVSFDEIVTYETTSHQQADIALLILIPKIQLYVRLLFFMWWSTMYLSPQLHRTWTSQLLDGSFPLNQLHVMFWLMWRIHLLEFWLWWSTIHLFIC